jgi:ribosomal protein S18 acetylase RimI-like enzyme
MELHRLGADEGARLRAIRLRSLRDAPDAFCSTHDEAAARPPESWRQQLVELATWVAVVGGDDVGLVRGARHDERPADAYLLSMWVAPEARGMGLGEALIHAVIGWARAAGYERLLLEVADENRPAIALYARLGFEPTGVTSTLPPPREHVREHQRALLL